MQLQAAKILEDAANAGKKPNFFYSENFMNIQEQEKLTKQASNLKFKLSLLLFSDIENKDRARLVRLNKKAQNRLHRRFNL